MREEWVESTLDELNAGDHVFVNTPWGWLTGYVSEVVGHAFALVATEDLVNVAPKLWAGKSLYIPRESLIAIQKKVRMKTSDEEFWELPDGVVHKVINGSYLVKISDDLALQVTSTGNTFYYSRVRNGPLIGENALNIIASPEVYAD